VQRERDVVLGRDGVAALAYVEQVRGRLVEQYRAGFEWMKQTELEEFGEVSYFTKRAAREVAETLVSDICCSGYHYSDFVVYI